MRTLIVIPARAGSTRFPMKPLVEVQGRSILRRVHDIAKSVPKIERVVVATDSPEIERVARGFGAEVVMTTESCRNGSERAWAAAEQLGGGFDIVVNLQGDAPLTPPAVITDTVCALVKNESWRAATPAIQLSWTDYEAMLNEKRSGRTSGTTVVFDESSRALYFSKNIIPNVRTRGGVLSPVFQHIGLYVYRSVTLERYVTLTPSRLEEVEQLEQLRLLEYGIPLHVVPVDLKGRTLWSIDHPEDALRVASIIEKEGELVP